MTALLVSLICFCLGLAANLAVESQRPGPFEPIGATFRLLESVACACFGLAFGAFMWWAWTVTA